MPLSLQSWEPLTIIDLNYTGSCLCGVDPVVPLYRAEKKNISKFMLAFWATPLLVQHGTVGPADYGMNMRAVCHKDVSE